MNGDGYLWPDGGMSANFADDAGGEYGVQYFDPDGSEAGPLSGAFVRQLADEIERGGWDAPRPKAAVLLRRIADDYDALLARSDRSREA